MGYRILTALFVLALMAGCAAFDTDSKPFEGFSPEETPETPGVTGGIYSGYYAGDMTLDSTSCASVSDAVGAKVQLALDVLQSDKVIDVTFDDGTTVASDLDGEKTTLMTETLGVRHIYYLTFADEKIDGSCEVIEADTNGQYGDPCASYTLALAKGEKPEGSSEEKPAEGEKPK